MTEIEKRLRNARLNTISLAAYEMWALAKKYMDCMDVPDDDPQRAVLEQSRLEIGQCLVYHAVDCDLLDWIDAQRTEDAPRFSAGISKNGSGFYLRGVRDRYCEDNVRDAIRKARKKVEDVK